MGLLAAAAIALSPTVSTLVPLGVEVILVAFRLGLHVERTASDITSLAADQGASWSCIIFGKTVDEVEVALTDFHGNDVSYKYPTVT